MSSLLLPWGFSHYLIETPFNTFANRTDPDQAALLPDQGLLCLLLKYDISDPTQLDLTNNFFVLCTNMKVYIYNYSKWVEPSMNIHEGMG